MARMVKIFDDELRVRRVFSQKQRASKSSYNHKQKVPQWNSRSNEVVIKITGNSKNFEAAKAHIDYITRKDDLEIKIDKDEIYQGKKETKEFKDILSQTIPKMNDIEGKEKRELMHITLSMNGYKKVSQEILEEAAMKTIKEMYPNNLSAFVFHDDTNNPHIHTLLSVKDNEGVRIDIRKKDLAELRKNFAKNLQDRGVDAAATIKRNFENENRKNHYYEVVDYGHAKYDFSEDQNAKNSFYVTYKSKSGLTHIWSNDLERVISENNVKKGEFARFKIVDKKAVTITAKKKVGSKIIEYKKETHRSIWDCSVQGREKDLSDPPKVKNIYELKEKSAISEFKKTKEKKVKTRIKDFSRLDKKKKDVER